MCNRHVLFALKLFPSMVIRLSVLFFFLLFPAVGVSQSVITLEEAIQISLENNYQLRQAENNLSLTSTQIESAYANFLPSLNASFGGNQNVGQQFSQELVSLVNITTYGMSGGLSTNIP